jgi:hypothetical protein
MTQVQQDLEAAQSYLEEHGWCQGRGQGIDGSVCIEGAVAAVTMGNAHFWHTRRGHVMAHNLPDGCFTPVHISRDLMLRHCDAKEALQRQAGRNRDLWAWNDFPERTVEEIKELFRAAIKAEMEVDS